MRAFSLPGHCRSWTNLRVRVLLRPPPPSSQLNRQSMRPAAAIVTASEMGLGGLLTMAVGVIMTHTVEPDRAAAAAAAAAGKAQQGGAAIDGALEDEYGALVALLLGATDCKSHRPPTEIA
jgi:hypothetical protein